MQSLEQAEQVVDALAQQGTVDMQREENFSGITVAERVATLGFGGRSACPHAPQVGQHDVPAAFRETLCWPPLSEFAGSIGTNFQNDRSVRVRLFRHELDRGKCDPRLGLDH